MDATPHSNQRCPLFALVGNSRLLDVCDSRDSACCQPNRGSRQVGWRISMRIPAPRPLGHNHQVQWLRRHTQPRHLPSMQHHTAMAMAIRRMWTPMSCARYSSQASCCVVFQWSLCGIKMIACAF